MKQHTAKICLSILCAAVAPAWADPAKVKQVADQAVIEFQPGNAGRISYLKAAKAQFETPNAKIGELQEGWSCGRSTDIIWNNKAYKLFSSKLDKSFRSVLEKAHYPVPITTDSVFDAPSDKPKPKALPEFQVGILIKDIAANLCLKNNNAIGGAYMKVFWQVYAPDLNRIVLEATTEGSFQTEAAEEIPVDRIFLRAYEQAARNFLAEPRFNNAVMSAVSGPSSTPGTPGTPSTPATSSAETIRLKRSKMPDQALAKHITELRSAVVTVLNSTGSGSGFFISDGYLLTNQHVIGRDKFVKVKLPTGRELIGEVLRSDGERDVALIKTEPIGVPALAIRGDEANIGEDLYVIGSPLGETFNTSLTRGILSGYRKMKEQRYIQSDVAILSGNSGGPLLDAKGAVIGITVSRLGNDKVMSGMSFFIPVNDALGKLGLELN